MATPVTRKIELNVGNWGCKSDNKTALHLADIMEKNESNYTINKLHRILHFYYKKMINLIGIGEYQKYYMLLVKNDTTVMLDKIEINSHKTRTHIDSLMAMIHRSFINLNYDENNEYPKV